MSDISISFDTPNQDAVDLIKSKAPVTREVFDQLLPELRNRAFTITGVEGANVLQRIRDAIAGIASGTTWDDAKQQIVGELDPFLGDGAERRAELLLRTHGFQAFQAGTWNVAQADYDTTHLQYLTMEDDRVRPGHAALDGVILPKDDPFWDDHFPPWEWGCRCRVRPMNQDLVDDASDADENRAPENKLVMEGAALRRLREGQIIRDGKATSVLPPQGDHAYSFDPGSLQIPLDQLEKQYDPPVWTAFQAFAQNQKAGGQSLWDWLQGKKPEPLQFKEVAPAREWADANMHPEDLELTPAEKAALSEYQESSFYLNSGLMRNTLNEEEKEQVHAIDQVMERSTTPQPITVWHGSPMESWAALKPDQTVDLKNFLSTTLAENMQDFKDRAWLTIHLPDGTNAVYMDKISGHESFAEEAELVLSRFLRLRIISVEQRGGITYIEADAVK